MRPSVSVPAGLTVLLAVLLALGGTNRGVQVLDDLIVLALSTYATGCAVGAAKSADGRVRSAWTAMAVALGAWAAGDAVWFLYDVLLNSAAPVPSAADGFYLLFAGFAAAAMAQFPVESTRQSRLRIVLDAITVALCLFLLSWILVLNTVYDANRENGLALGVALLYPVSDLVVLTIAVIVLIRAEAGQRMVLSLLTLGIVLTTVADSAFAYLVVDEKYDTGHPIDILWAASLVAFSVAALLSREAPRPTRPAASAPSDSSLWLPYVPLLLAGTIGPPLVMTGLERILVPLIVVAVCLRQCVAAWENRRLLSAAADQALRDPLTGLGNRTLFHDRLTHAMALRVRDDRWVAVVSLDLDDFTMVNDSLGHPAADDLLIHVGKRVADCARPGDTVARIGGDEFAMLLEGRLDDSELVAQRVVEAFNEPFEVDGQHMLMRPSVGVAVASPAELDLAPDTLVRRADIAMYAAKRSRSSEVHTFNPDMLLVDPDLVESVGNGAGRRAGEGAAKVRLLGELRNAIDRGGLDVVYQPKVELRSQRIIGVEALLRWSHPTLGMLRPDSFMSLVRQHGLMRPVTDLVVNRALDDTAHWTTLGVEVPVAVNVFAPFLRDRHLPGALRRALADRGLPARLLTVEITEDLVLSDVVLVTTVLQLLREHGIRVAIDDFGSGYSALSYLRDLQIDEVKLDRSFIASVTVDPRAAAVVRAVIDLTHDLGITVVAEGIEDAETSAWLCEHHCDVGQGYYFGKPIAASEIPHLVALNTEHAT